MESIDTSNNIIAHYRNLTSAHPLFGWQASSVIFSVAYNFDCMVNNNVSAHLVDLSHIAKMITTQSTFSNSTFSTNTKNQ